MLLGFLIYIYVTQKYHIVNSQFFIHFKGIHLMRSNKIIQFNTHTVYGTLGAAWAYIDREKKAGEN